MMILHNIYKKYLLFARRRRKRNEKPRIIVNFAAWERERKITAIVNSLSEKPRPKCGTIITPGYVVIVIMERARTVVC